MSQTKYPMSGEARRIVISYIRSYDRILRWYMEQRDKIIYSSPARMEVYLDKSDRFGTAWAYQPAAHGFAGDPAGSRGARLATLDAHPNVAIMRAIEQAKNCIGADIVSDAARERLIKEIWTSCIMGRNYKFIPGVVPLERTNFYERRREFLWRIAYKLDLL